MLRLYIWQSYLLGISDMISNPKNICLHVQIVRASFRAPLERRNPKHRNKKNVEIVNECIWKTQD
jgi:hypothetical protein